MVRLIDSPWSIIKKLSSREILEAIKLSEGRVIAAEVVVTSESLIDGVSNVEIAAAFGADIIILNFFDILKKQISGIPSEIDSIAKLRDFLGRIIGMNLEPVREDKAKELGYTPGRLATPENAELAVKDGIDIIVITANPKTRVSLGDIVNATQEIGDAIGEKAIILAGKMHLAGRYGERYTSETIEKLSKAGADGILIPAPGTIPGFTVDIAKQIVNNVHELGLIVMSCIGTSQEGADEETIKRIAIMGKMSGADIHHIGDSGYRPGVTIPENIMTYSITIRGKRHTYRRMAQSILR